MIRIRSLSQALAVALVIGASSAHADDLIQVYQEARASDPTLSGAEATKLATDEVARALPSLFPDRDPQQLKAWAEKFARLFTQSIFKWVQSPLAIHVGSLELDRERALQLPVVQRTEWSGD